LCRHRLFAAWDGCGCYAPLAVRRPANPRRLNTADLAVSVVQEGQGGRQVTARIGTAYEDRLLLSVISALDRRPLRPGIIVPALCRRFRHDLKLAYTAAALADRCRDTVCAGVPAADHHDIQTADIDGRPPFRLPVKQPARAGGQVIDGEMDPAEAAARDRQVARSGGAAAQHHGIVGRTDLRHGQVAADFAAGDKLDALVSHERDPPGDPGFVQLHVGDAVGQQAAGPVGAFVDDYLVAGLVELVGAGQSGRSGTDDRHAFARAPFRGLRPHPPFGPGPVDDGAFVGLDRDRGIV